MLKRYAKNEEGAAAIVFALTIPVIIGGITLAVELGHWHQNKSKLQDLADVSAKAAAYELQILGDQADYKLAGEGHVFENGFKFNDKNSVTVLSPPPAGDYAGKNAVEVTLRQEQPMYFAKYFGDKSFKLETKATAIVLDGVPACILSLRPTGNPGISNGGSTKITLNGCGVHANSNSDKAIDVEDFIADCISAVGGIQTTAETVIECDEVDDYTSPVRDPYADLTVPSSVSSMPCSTPTKGPGKNVKLLTPGRYCSGVYGKGLIDFTQPGTYYFDGADLGTNSQHSMIYGDGVTLVFMNGGMFHGAQGGTINLTAPTTGDYAGLAMVFDRDTTPLDSWLTINGNAASKIEGTIYAPTLNLKMVGTANATSKCTQIIGYTVDFNGNAEFTNENCENMGAKRIGGLVGVALVE